MKVSFIIPIYKVEKYLEQCVNSVLNQTYRDIEVVLVDDGSPDNCPAMCDTFAEKDKRVKVVHKQNGGLSDARNVGLQNATGEYVIFIDSDDFWPNEDSLKKLMNEVATHSKCEFIGFNCSYYYPNNETVKKWVIYKDELAKPVDKNEAMSALVSSGTMPMSACLKIIQRKFLIDNNIFFKVGQICEDIPWFINLLEKSTTCKFVNQYIYAYRQNVVGSISNSFSERSYNSLFDIIQTEIEEIDNRSFNKEAKDALYSFLAYEFCILLSTVRYLNNAQKRRKDLYTYKWLLQYTLNPKVKKVALVNKFLGIRITELLLDFYNRKIRK